MSGRICCPNCGSYNVIGVAEIPVKFNLGGTGLNVLSSTDDMIGHILDNIESETIGIVCKDCKFHHYTLDLNKLGIGDK